MAAILSRGRWVNTLWPGDDVRRQNFCSIYVLLIAPLVRKKIMKSNKVTPKMPSAKWRPFFRPRCFNRRGLNRLSRALFLKIRMLSRGQTDQQLCSPTPKDRHADNLRYNWRWQSCHWYDLSVYSLKSVTFWSSLGITNTTIRHGAFCFTLIVRVSECFPSKPLLSYLWRVIASTSDEKCELIHGGLNKMADIHRRHF